MRTELYLMLAIAALVAALPAALARTNSATLPQRALRSALPDPLQGADMRCAGSHEAARACLFKDLYYDQMKKQFVFFGEVPGLEGEQDTEVLSAGFAELIDFLDEPMRNGDFGFVVSREGAPPNHRTCSVSMPIHLRHEYPFGTQSIGHLIRDNFQALVEIPLNFGMNASRFTWASWPRRTGNRPFELTHAMQKYSYLVTNHKPYKWPQLVHECSAGLLGSGMPDTEQERSIRYIHIEQALASGAGFDWTDDGDTTEICRNAKFREMRDLAYSLFDVPHEPVEEKERVLLSIVVKLDGDKRRLKVPGEVTQAVQAKYPEIDVEWHVVAHEGVEAQVNWLSRTSIFVANIGSPSFRLVYLPDGAQVILVGALETETKGLDGDLHYNGRPFREAEKCWSQLGYVGIHPYHVMSDEDVELSDQLRHDARAGSKRDWEVVRIRDAHVTVRIEPFMEVVDNAMANIRGGASAQVA